MATAMLCGLSAYGFCWGPGARSTSSLGAATDSFQSTFVHIPVGVRPPLGSCFHAGGWAQLNETFNHSWPAQWAGGYDKNTF